MARRRSACCRGAARCCGCLVCLHLPTWSSLATSKAPTSTRGRVVSRLNTAEWNAGPQVHLLLSQQSMWRAVQVSTGAMQEPEHLETIESNKQSIVHSPLFLLHACPCQMTAGQLRRSVPRRAPAEIQNASSTQGFLQSAHAHSMHTINNHQPQGRFST